MANIPQSRRNFITSLALLLGSASLLWRYLTPRSTGTGQALLRVRSSDIPSNGALVFREQRLALFRDNQGVYALSLICTHLGCTVTVSVGELVCPCHGSRFDRQGMVLNGPADNPLKRLKVVERDGMVEVVSGPYPTSHAEASTE